MARGHASSYGARIDGIVLSVTKSTFPVKHVKLCAWYIYGHSTEMVARKMIATDFSTETPSKRRKTISSVQPTGPSTPTNLATSCMGQIGKSIARCT